MEATLIYPALAQTPTRTVVVWLSHPTPDPRWLLKRQDSIPAGARWITVHPNGKGEKGQPVLIQETSPGSGVHRVIGGAGGSLNYLKMTGVRSEAEYRRTAADRKKAKAEQRKEQRKQDKALGLAKPKQEAKARIDEALAKKRAEIIQQAAAAMGWEGHQFDPEPYQDLSKEAQTKAYREHQAEWLGKAREAIDVNRKALLHDHEARAEVLPEVPVASDEASVISLPDLAPEPPSGGTGLGYRVDYRGEAEKHGHTETAIQAEKAALDAQAPAEVQEATAKRRATVEAIKTELASARADDAPKDAPIKLLKAEQAAELLKADKELRMLEQQARKAKQKINESTELPGAAVLEVSGEEVDEALKKEFDEDLRVASTTAFLSEASKLGTTAKHLGIGAYNSLNALSVAVAGVGLVDRMTLDVLGVAATADVLARRLHHDLGPDEAARIHDAVTDYHKDHYLRASEQAVSEAMRWQTAAEGLAVEAAESGADLARMQEINTKRREAIEQAQRIMGQTLGEMEANAALVLALGRKPKEQIELSLGQRSTESAVRRVRALGLQPGDYEIHSVGSERFLTLRGSGMDKLAESIDAEGERVTRRALAIQAGKEDVDGWLPEGMADRPDLAAKSAAAPGVAPRFAEPFRPGPDMAQSVRDYVGARAADGDLARDIVADLNSEEMAQHAGARRDEYLAAVDAVANLKGADGKRVHADTLQEPFEQLADAYVERRFGTARSALHRQQIPVDEVSVEALHRAFAAEPAGPLAYKAIGDLTAKEQGALRDYWWSTIGAKDTAADELRERLGSLDANEPTRSEVDMFGEEVENPAWRQWKQERDGLAEEISATGLSWPQYVKVMGGTTKAYATVQDLIRHQVTSSFAETYNSLRPDQPLKTGRAMLTNHLGHLDATDPAARETRLRQHLEMVDDLRERDRGRYAAGSVADRIDEHKAQSEAFAQSQMGLFGDLDFGQPEAPAEAPLKPGERRTLGVAAERTLAGMAGIVGQNFRPGKPVKLWHSSMDGKYVNGQRAVKLLENSKRLILSQGVGSGKTKMCLAAFAHLHQQGKVKHGLYAVPSVVQGQFGGEALRYLEPNSFKWHAEPGASREERLAAYKDPDTHFTVVTHQSLRDDLVYLGAQQAGISESDMAEQVRAMSGPERKTWMRGVMDGHGMDHDFLMVDEGHDLLDRAGKETSLMAGVIDAVAHNTSYYISASADPIKNDPSEAFSLLSKVDPERYNDPAAFKRRYGVDTPAAQTALRREMARYHFPGKIDPGVDVKHEVREVKLSEAQHAEIKAIERAAGQARLARIKGEVDIDALKTLSPSSFANVDAGRHREVAEALSKNLGIIKDSAVRRAINEHPASAKLDQVSELAKAKRGTPGVIFAHSRAAVAALERRLTADGHRVVTVTGADSAKDKDRKRLAFHPESGEPEADILIASDAGATGLNLQRGQWLAQYDTPDTSKGWHQRNGRIARLGQKNNVDLIDLVGDHPVERRARERLARKDELRQILTTPLDTADDTGIAAYLNRASVEQQQASLF